MILLTLLRFSEMHESTGKIHFHYLISPVYLPKRTELKSYITQIFRKETKSLSRLDYIFCSDEYLLKINQQHLHHDFYTDIISFDLSENHEVVGEIYISLERVRENAKAFQSSLLTETLRVVFHGALHLCGYGDKTRDQKTLMTQKEDYYIKRYFKMFHVETKFK